MQLKVLENDGTIISGTEGAVINYALGYRQGVIYDRLGRFAVSYSSNSVTIQPGHLMIRGLSIILEQATTIPISSYAQETSVHLIVDVRATNDGITAELYATDAPQFQYDLNYNNEKISGRYTYDLGVLIVGSSGITRFNNYIQYTQPYPSLYENVIKISDQTHEGFVEFIIQFTSTLDKTDLEGFTIDEFLVENQAYMGFGYVSSGTTYDDGPGIFRFNFVTQEGCSKEDYRGGGINFSLQGNENFEVLGSRKIM